MKQFLKIMSVFHSLGEGLDLDGVGRETAKVYVSSLPFSVLSSLAVLIGA